MHTLFHRKVQPMHKRVRDDQDKHTILIQEFTKTGLLLFGDNWKGPLSVALGYAASRSSVRRWLSGEFPFPANLREQLHGLLLERLPVLDALLAQLHRPLPNRGHKEINRLQTLEMNDIGRILYGKLWKKTLSEKLSYCRSPITEPDYHENYSRWGTFAWREGKRAFPVTIRPQLAGLLLQRRHCIAQLAEQLSQPIAKLENQQPLR